MITNVTSTIASAPKAISGFSDTFPRISTALSSIKESVSTTIGKASFAYGVFAAQHPYAATALKIVKFAAILGVVGLVVKKAWDRYASDSLKERVQAFQAYALSFVARKQPAVGRSGE